MYEIDSNYNKQLELEYLRCRPELRVAYRCNKLNNNTVVLYNYNRNLTNEQISNYRNFIAQNQEVWALSVWVSNNKSAYDIRIEIPDIQEIFFIDFMKPEVEYVLLFNKQFLKEKNIDIFQNVQKNGIDLYYKSELAEYSKVHFDVCLSTYQKFFYLKKNNETSMSILDNNYEYEAYKRCNQMNI